MSNLNPLRKWVLKNKYFIKVSETKEIKATGTHFLLDGGIWKIPKNEYLEFLRLLAVDLGNSEKHYISENRTEVFRLIVDLDFYEESEIKINEIEKVISVLQAVITDYFGEKNVIVCGSDSKIVVKDLITYVKSGFHLVWPKVWVTVETAKALRLLFIETLISTFNERDAINTWGDVVDLAVYEDNGLRMIGCRKIGICKGCKNKKDIRVDCQLCSGAGKIDEGRVYSPKLILPKTENNFEFLNVLKKDYYVQLLETSIYNYNELAETTLIKKLKIEKNEKNESVSKKKAKVDTEDATLIKIETFIRRNFKDHYSRIKVKKLTKNDDRYFVEVDENFCMNVNREHTSSAIYFQINEHGISQRCFCKKTTLDGRLQGPCTNFASKVIPVTKVLNGLLFGNKGKNGKNGKKISKMVISRNSSTSTLDLGSAILNKKLFSSKEICLENCKSILFQLEKDLLN